MELVFYAVGPCTGYLTFRLLAIINERLELGMRNLAWRWIISVPTDFVRSIFRVLKITNKAT